MNTYVPGTTVNALQLITHLTLQTTQWPRYHLYFTFEEISAQRG